MRLCRPTPFDLGLDPKVNTLVLCQCPGCDLVAISGVPVRRSEGHLGVRFGDYRWQAFGLSGDWRISVEGVDVSNDCVEVMAGDPGWAWVLLSGEPPDGACRYCHSACKVLYLGHVVVQYQMVPTP